MAENGGGREGAGIPGLVQEGGCRRRGWKNGARVVPALSSLGGCCGSIVGLLYRVMNNPLVDVTMITALWHACRVGWCVAR